MRGAADPDPYENPLSPLTLVGGEAALRELHFPERTPTLVTAAQKVAWAVAATPTPIVVPCHRVVRADGSLTGYRGGPRRKRALLSFEAAGARPLESSVHEGQLALR
jgi:hypothetical protein